MIEEAARHGLGQQPVAILGEDAVIPDGFVHVHPDKPAKQEVVIELFHQQPLAADRVEQLQQLRAEQALGGNRRPADAAIQPLELRRHLAQDLVDQLANRSQRMRRRHPLLSGHVTEHRLGLTVVSSHARHRSTCRRPRRSITIRFSTSS